MVAAMEAGVQVCACCPCCYSPSASSSASASASSRSPSFAVSSSTSACVTLSRVPPGLTKSTSNRRLHNFRTSTVELISISTNRHSFGFRGSDSDTRKLLGERSSSSAPAAAAVFTSPFTLCLRRNHIDKKSPRQAQLWRVLPDSSLAERSAELGDGQEESMEEGVDPASITEWELDFCSRPILDSRGKKIWELVVCDGERHLQFARFFPNNVINSGTLRDAMKYIIDTLGVPKPQKVRFFRSQMQTIIGKACVELDIQPVPSKRCIQLVRWLDERYQTVYREHPGYQEGAGPLTLLEQPAPVEVPDTLRGEQWAFVQLRLSALLEEIASVERGDQFGSYFDLETFGVDLSSDEMIPGVAVASKRAVPLAAWTNALELSSIDIDMGKSCLILSSGVSERWRYAFWRRGEQGDQEAEAWERAKTRVGGLHFLAIQQSLESELCAGFWLLVNPPKSPV